MKAKREALMSERKAMRAVMKEAMRKVQEAEEAHGADEQRGRVAVKA